ncbi:hypothetical protein [Psychromonas aquimarina]|uniref:hypothetical protein n=1 Tax=Psychromonas aquimarina TaxID=444919 RepID=UPI00041465F5|nr:hypothetical protein [Psychromonas aquimarina]
MGEVIAQLIIIGGNHLAFHLGRLFLTICSFGKLSIEPLPKKYPANWVQAFDGEKVEQASTKAHYNMSYSIAIAIGCVIIITLFGFGLFFFSEALFEQKLQSIN